MLENFLDFFGDVFSDFWAGFQDFWKHLFDIVTGIF
jgi:hypothetical protein